MRENVKTSVQTCGQTPAASEHAVQTNTGLGATVGGIGANVAIIQTTVGSRGRGRGCSGRGRGRRGGACAVRRRSGSGSVRLTPNTIGGDVTTGILGHTISLSYWGMLRKATFNETEIHRQHFVV